MTGPLSQAVPCPECGGSGEKPIAMRGEDVEIGSCGLCGGTGEVPPALPRCATCAHWKPYRDLYPGNSWGPRKNAGGLCIEGQHIGEPLQLPSVGGDHSYDGTYTADRMVYSYDEGGDFWTGPEFGCVHHQEKQS